MRKILSYQELVTVFGIRVSEHVCDHDMIIVSKMTLIISDGLGPLIIFCIIYF